MTTDPRAWATFYIEGKPDRLLLRNDLGESIVITREASGDVAIMLADWCRDPDLCRFVGDTWRGRADSLEEYPEDEDDEELLDEQEIDDESMIDLGGGMVVPLKELLEDDDEP